MRIQDYPIAAVQNIRLLITHAKPIPAQVVALRVNQPLILPRDP